MIDNLNPTSQFHPYTPMNDTPATERLSTVRSGVSGKLDNLRAYARQNPGRVLGGLAALVIGAGLMRRRML
jgi:hypothetical protein